jgi:hypothetical protein
VSRLRDPWWQAVAVFAGLVVAGFALLAVAWRGVARTVFVPYQLPWVMSAGVAGLALIGAALGLLTIHIGRRDDAVHRAEFDDFTNTFTELIQDFRTHA